MIFKLKTTEKYFNQCTAALTYKRYWKLKLDQSFTHVEITNTADGEIRTFSADEFRRTFIGERHAKDATKLFIFDYNRLLIRYRPTQTHTNLTTNTNDHILTQNDLAQRWDIKPCRISELHRFGVLKPASKDGRTLLYDYKEVATCEQNIYFQHWVQATSKLGGY